MPTSGNHTLDLILACCIGGVLLLIGYRVGRWFGSLAAAALIASKEQELFTTQRGFKSLYENELAALKAENAQLKASTATLETRVEEYRKKAAGYGGLFSSGGKRADAMYALLLENEALEEALHAQSEKLSNERADGLKETLRSTGYRRVLISQLMNDERIKSYVAEVLADDKHLPGAATEVHALPDATKSNG